jgi:hypothetical protein
LKPTIFFVQNDPAVKSPFMDIVENDFDLIEVAPCSSVLPLLKTTIPDLIILNEEIGDAAAYEVCRQIRSSNEYHSMPVIFIGSPLSSGQKIRFVESGADDYYAEPFDTGNIIAYLKAIVNRRKESPYLLRENADIFRKMYDLSSIGIVRRSFHTKKIVSANPAFCSLFGYTEDELIGKTIQELTYAEDIPPSLGQLNKVHAGEFSSFSMEKRYVRKDGNIFWALTNSNLVSDENGNPLYFIAYIQDITDKKRSRSLLERSEKKYRTYVDRSPNPIFVRDLGGKYIDVNPSACEITGYSREELIGMDIADLYAPEYVKPASKSLQQVLSGENSSEEFRFIKKDGTPYYMTVSTVLADGIVISICADTTERKIIEKLLIKAKLLAEDASRSKTEFVANISHELRTPLNIVMGYIDVLLSETAGELNEKQKMYTDRVKDAGYSLLESVNSLIYVAEIEAGDWEVHIREFYLPSIIGDMEKLCRSEAFKKGISIEFELGSDITSIYADESKFKIILHHLIGNSLKFTPDGGSVKVLIGRSGTDLCVSVIDTGIGMSEEKQDDLFKPFVQADWSHARIYGGMGIGLTLVKEIIEMHGGSINLKSKSGEGTTITFTIPQNVSGESEVASHALDVV